jgi:hypothetical protein
MRRRRCFTLAVIALSILTFNPSVLHAEWDQIVEAAKREGKVVVIGTRGPEARDALTKGFQRKYPGIQVDLTGMAGNEFLPNCLMSLQPDDIRPTWSLREPRPPLRACCRLTPLLLFSRC